MAAATCGEVAGKRVCAEASCERAQRPRGARVQARRAAAGCSLAALRLLSQLRRSARAARSKTSTARPSAHRRRPCTRPPGLRPAAAATTDTRAAAAEEAPRRSEPLELALASSSSDRFCSAAKALAMPVTRRGGISERRPTLRPVARAARLHGALFPVVGFRIQGAGGRCSIVSGAARREDERLSAALGGCASGALPAPCPLSAAEEGAHTRRPGASQAHAPPPASAPRSRASTRAAGGKQRGREDGGRRRRRRAHLAR
jgi:hypothetical protein